MSPRARKTVCARGSNPAAVAGPSTSPLDLPRHDVPTALLLLPGVLLGMILIPAIMRWGLLVHTSLTKHGGDFLGAPHRRLLWSAPLVILFHPIPYIVVGLLLASALAAIGRLSAGWGWLLVSFYAYAAMIGFVVIPKLLALRKIRRDGRKV